MPQRVSHSVLDPYLTKPLKSLYGALRIPAGVPPEAIVGVGHLAAIAGAVGFAYCGSAWWGGLLGAAGVAGNHTADVLDGTHARATGQCRNGGELLDHFVDPLSFTYWVAGLAVSADAPWLALAGVTIIYATAVLTNIRAKMIGEFSLARFGPTEFKTLLMLFGIWQSVQLFRDAAATSTAARTAWWFVAAMTVAGGVQLAISLWRAVVEVNTRATQAADTTEWVVK